jgi:type II secretory pathway pseudopilin PulG
LKKNNRGFTLVEILMVVGMIAGMSLVVMNISKQSTKSSTQLQFDSETTLITNEINASLTKPEQCLTTFTNATQLAPPNSPTLLTTPTANILSPTGIASTPSSTRRYSISGGPYGNGGVKIASYTLDLTASPDKLLTIQYSKKTILGGGTVPKTIKLYVEQDGTGLIIACRALSGSSVDIWSHGAGTDIFYNGNVGIGTTTPTYSLTVGSSTEGNALGVSASGDMIVTGGSDRNWALFKTDAVGVLQSMMFINTSNQVSFNSGNVGIGTSAPTAALEVAGGIKPGAASTGAACTPEGAFAYDLGTHAPVYCSNLLLWTAMGGGGGWKIGGLYTMGNGGSGCDHVNPITGGYSCPAGYTNSIVHNSYYAWGACPNVQYYLHLCWKI